MNVGFVGLGSQGAGMAHAIAGAGHALSLWARREGSLEPFRGTGARIASSLRDLAAGADVVGICVVDDEDVEQVVLGDNLLAGMQQGSVLLVHSTVHPDTCRRLAESAGEKGVSLLDAPVSGGGQKAIERQLVVMVGGDRDVFERCRPVLDSYGDPVRYLGGVGAGQLCKLINNAAFIANLGVAADAFELATAHELDRTALCEVLAASSGGSFPMQLLRSEEQLQLLVGAASVLEKDLALATRIARAVDLELPAVEAAARRALDRLAALSSSAEPGS